MADDSNEKTEQPTEQRREDFRKRGQVAQSKELASVLILLGAALCVFALSRFLLKQIWLIFEFCFQGRLLELIQLEDYRTPMLFVGEKAFLMLAPLLLLVGILSVSSSVLQIGFKLSQEALKPDLNKINPINGFKRIFSLRSVVEGAKSSFKISLIICILFLILKAEIFHLPYLAQLGVDQLFVYLGDMVLKLLGGVGLFMFLVAILDYAYQRYDLEQKMKMTKQEVKEESKNKEGDPLIKSRVRRIQREMANQRMMNDVPGAEVIVTNPTHIAVALKYSPELPAPQVIAKGADHIAEKIKSVAREHKIPIVENKPLARTMFKTLKIGEVIPRDLFKAVAEVLSYVYRLKRKKVVAHIGIGS